MYKILKRVFDITFSLAALLASLPVMIPVCIILLCTGTRHAIYLQKRVGYKNKHFAMWKLVTMRENSLNEGTGAITVRDDPRVFPFGMLLRKAKINELPQLVNVLKGDMSIVGPRPLVDETFVLYPAAVQACIYDSKPGLTSIGSIIFRDEEAYVSRAKDTKDFYKSVVQVYKGELEMWYLKNKSFLTDLLIIFLTAWVVLLPGKNDIIYRIFKDLPRRDLEGSLRVYNAQHQ